MSFKLSVLSGLVALGLALPSLDANAIEVTSKARQIAK